jgi:hypothetical protein
LSTALRGIPSSAQQAQTPKQVSREQLRQTPPAEGFMTWSSQETLGYYGSHFLLPSKLPETVITFLEKKISHLLP